ncbi:class II aldolase/adducin family protein [Candidatus Babeliales bacterium]|nr:class II aldolase/adducin family protein [Candidatus Babeliales bacterium]
MNELNNFVHLSKYAGQRFDLVQAGGGNSSVKLKDGSLLIKASGFSLSEVETTTGYAIVDNQKLVATAFDPKIFTIADKYEREQAAKKRVDQALIQATHRPSIETLLHSLLDKYTLHTHPIALNSLACKANWKELFFSLLPDALLVDYHTPGIDLALALKQGIIDLGISPNIIILQNHGLIVTAATAEEVIFLTEQTLAIVEEFLDISFEPYKFTTQISKLCNTLANNVSTVAYLSRDRELTSLALNNKEILFLPPFCPDALVYCGASALELANLNDTQPVSDYFLQYHELPKVIVYQNHLFFIAHNIKKAKEIEEVYKFHILALHAAYQIPGPVNYLSPQELSYLNNWEAEKYRQKRA